MDNPLAYIRARKHDYETLTVPTFDGHEFSQYETLKQIDSYWSNRYVDDASDDVIGDFPFDNVSKFRVLLEARATDFDTKHVEVEPDKSDRETRVKAMVSTRALRKYMDETGFAKFLNDLCITRPKYGGVLVKKTEDGVFVIPWENLITDQSDIMGGVRIERHYLTPSQLKEKGKAWENVDAALETAMEWREKDMSQERAETQGDLIEVYELQGNVPLSLYENAVALMNGENYIADPAKDLEFVEAKIIACGADWVEEHESSGSKVKVEKGIVMYAREEQSTHRYLARNPRAGIGLGEGVVESLFEHQKWHNFTKTEEMRMLAIAGKKLYVTDDPDVLANVFGDGVEHGTVLRVGQGKTLTELNQLPTGVPVYQTVRQEWDESASRVTSSFNAKIGEESKSGTPFRAQYLQNLEASSQFEQYREEIGEFVRPIIEEWLLPDALKKVADADELYDTFTPAELQLIDEAIVNESVNRRVLDATLSGQVLAPEDVERFTLEAQDSLRKQGGKRYLTEFKKFLKDAGGCVTIRVTDESKNKAVYFESLGNAIALLAPEDPRRNALIDRILEAIGISREELESYDAQYLSAQNPELKTEELAKVGAAQVAAA